MAHKTQERFVDLDFPIQKRLINADGSQRFVVSGIYQGKTLGFAFDLPLDWKQDKLGDARTITFQAEITVSSIGSQSDQFLATLKELYQLPAANARMNQSVKFAAISLEGDPRHPERGEVMMKLFFEPKENDPKFDDLYAEFYLNINLSTNVVELHEKDPEYRSPFIDSLTAKE